jgi:hypothetical protein
MAREAWNKGKKWSKDIKEKISVSLKGRAPWNKGKVGMMPAPWNKGKNWDEATKKRIGEARKGIAPWNKGKQWPDEVKEKIRLAAKKRYEHTGLDNTKQTS